MTSATDTRRRVKLYALNAERQWDDRGTGHVSSGFSDKLKAWALVVRAEADGALLLESAIEPDTAYQKQQETLIVWSEADNYDLALSFQERAGCDDIWAKICHVQGKDPSVDITQDVQDDDDDTSAADDASAALTQSSSSSSSLVIELPSDAELADKLDELCELMQSCLPYPIKREKLALQLEADNYIKKLLRLFHESERRDDTRRLHKLYDIFKNIFLLNKNPLFEAMLNDDQVLWDIIGVFEYDPSLPRGHKNHRHFLAQEARFRQVLPLQSRELVQKIHQTYRVQYIQDVVLPTPSVFEENLLSTLSSFIFFNKVEIVALVQEDEKFLRALFAQLAQRELEVERRRELVLFLKEFCAFSQTLQPANRDAFFKSLAQFGVLPTLAVVLRDEDAQVKLAAVDVLTHVVEFSPSMLREHVLGAGDGADNIVNIVIEQMICDCDPELAMATQLAGVVKLLLDPENMLASGSSVNKSEKTDFLNHFYKHCMHVLVAPILACGEPATGASAAAAESGASAQLLAIIVELLSFCVEHHAYHIRNYVLHRDLLRRVLHQFMRSKHTFLVLTSLRFLRKIIGLKDEFYNRHIVAGNLIAPVVDALVANGGRYNLLDSAIVELFEFVRTEEIKSLCLYIMDKFWPQFEQIDYVRTFKGLKLQFEQHQDRINDNNRNIDNTASVLLSRRFRRDPRQMDDDEEMWFNNEDDDCDDCDPAVTHSSISYKLETEFNEFNKKVLENRKNLNLSSYVSEMAEQVKKSKEYDISEQMIAMTTTQTTASLTASTTTTSAATAKQQTSGADVSPGLTSARKALVDYDNDDSDDDSDDDDDEEDDECETSSAGPLTSAVSSASAVVAVDDDDDDDDRQVKRARLSN